MTVEGELYFRGSFVGEDAWHGGGEIKNSKARVFPFSVMYPIRKGLVVYSLEVQEISEAIDCIRCSV